MTSIVIELQARDERDVAAGIEPVLEMFSKRRLARAKPLDLAQFDSMPP